MIYCHGTQPELTSFDVWTRRQTTYCTSRNTSVNYFISPNHITQHFNLSAHFKLRVVQLESRKIPVNIAVFRLSVAGIIMHTVLMTFAIMSMSKSNSVKF